VGSKALVEEYNRCQPSYDSQCDGRVRESGLLYQPHTSAGRVPSDSGSDLCRPVDYTFRHPDATLGALTKSDLGGRSPEAPLQGAAQILATVSGYSDYNASDQYRSVTTFATGASLIRR